MQDAKRQRIKQEGILELEEQQRLEKEYVKYIRLQKI
jgi:hypothetical protein